MSRNLPTQTVRAVTRDEGVALVEFALVLPLLLLMLLAMVDFGKVFNYWIDETHLANEGARYAAVNKNPSTGGLSLQQYLLAEAGVDSNELENGGTTSLPSGAQVCISFPNGSANVGDPVKVTLSADYQFLPFLGSKLTVTHKAISGSSVMRLEAPATNYAAGCS
jgi:Flp pilus assembly protein TadG